MGRVTIKDVAREAGVSLSTVNKALTGKKGITAELKQKVLDTVARLDYKTNHVAGSLARNTIRIGIIVPNDWEDYYNDICAGITYGTERLVDWNFEGVTLKYSVKDADAEEQALECFRKIHRDGITAAVFCHGNYSTYKKAFDYAAEKKIDIICIGIGMVRRRSCFSTIEVDAYRCGRVAAEILEYFLPEGCGAAIIIGSDSVWPHAEKKRGFSDRLKEGTKVGFHSLLQSHDNDNEAYELTMDILKDDTVRGIFIATGAADGVCRAVIDSGKSGQIRIIATDISEKCRQYIENGTISATIYQNTFMQGAMAVNMLYRYFSVGARPHEEKFVPPTIFTKESLLPAENENMYMYLGDIYYR